VKSGKHLSIPRKQKRPLRAFPQHEQLLDLRWRINYDPEICVRDRKVKRFLFEWEIAQWDVSRYVKRDGSEELQIRNDEYGIRYRQCIFPSISEIDGLDEDLAGIFADLLTGYRFVSRFTPTKSGNDLSGKPIKTSIPGLPAHKYESYAYDVEQPEKSVRCKVVNEGDVRKAYQDLREWSDLLSPESHKGARLKAKIVRVMVQMLRVNGWHEEAFQVTAEAFTRIGEPLTSAAVRRAFFRSR
jgi:hypothetical protein